MSFSRIALSWSISQFHGWGIYGLHLLWAMLRAKRAPLLLHPPGRLALNPLQMLALLPVLERSAPLIRDLARRQTRHDGNALLLRHTNGAFVPAQSAFRAGMEVLITFFETVDLSPDAIAYAQTLPLVITGSRWNQQVLTERFRLTNVVCLMQGVDTAWFHPAPAQRLLPERFVIFSGGKLEFRKGQDLVIAAFRRFHARHPEAFLVTAWGNRWPSGASRFPETHVAGLPENQDLDGWMARHLPAGSYLDVGELAYPTIAPILREAQVALFPNRCEGGTNLVAMECMACGLPVILSDNTGHRELIAPDRCYPLTRQAPCRDPNDGSLLTDWGESDLEEMVAQLEAVYGSVEEARQRGHAASRFMREFSWERQCDRLLTLLDPHAPA